MVLIQHLGLVTDGRLIVSPQTTFRAGSVLLQIVGEQVSKSDGVKFRLSSVIKHVFSLNTEFTGLLTN